MRKKANILDAHTEHYLQFVRYCIDEACPVPDGLEQMDWAGLYEFATKQAILGIVFQGISKLPKDMPRPDYDLEFKWFGNAEQIRKQNIVLNLVSAKLSANLKKDGFRSCLLKGQGNALMYPNPLMRTSGDIDMWVDGKRRDIIRYTRQKCGNKVKKDYIHIEFPVLREVEMELHYTPSYIYNPVCNLRLQRYFMRSEEAQFTNATQLPETDKPVCVPTDELNLIQQLTHILHHFVTQGIGLRHFIDLYYLLRKDIPQPTRNTVVSLLNRLNMKRFTSGVMYILHRVLGLPEALLLLPANERVGQKVLQLIISEGNFGKTDALYSLEGKTYLQRAWVKTRKNMALSRIVPSESLTIFVGALCWKAYVALHDR